MTGHIKEANEVDVFCSNCLTCFSDEPPMCPECGEPSPDGGWKPIHASAKPFLGKTIDGRYLLDRYIGGGASGRVYRAEDTKLKRPFALKILDLSGEGDTDAENSVRRFENEVEALSRIRNPHVINIYESYRLDGGAPAMLTEYIEGVTLGEMLEERTWLDIETTVELIRQVANGLHEAHGRGVIHRDLKPANIMVEQLPAAGSFARILDFGLVHLSDTAGNTKGFWGTPLYAAPEQCAPGPPITAAADIYSLGCVVFHCVSGEPPFSETEPREIMRGHVDRTPPRLSEVADQDVPDRVDEIVAEMLNKDRDDRPEDLTDVIEALDEIRTDGGAWERAATGDELSEPEGSEDDEALQLDPSSQSPDGTRVGIAETDAGRPRIAQLLHSVDLGAQFSEIEEPIRTARLDRTGDGVVFSDAGSHVYVMSAKGDSYYQELAAVDAQITSVTADISRGRVFAVTDAGGVYKWRLHGIGEGAKREVSFGEELFGLTLGSEGQCLYVGTDEGRVLKHDLRVDTSTEICSIPEKATSLYVSRDGEWLFAATDRGGLFAVQTRGDETNVLRIASIDEAIRSIEFAAESGVVAVVDGESRLRLFHIRESLADSTASPDVTNLRAITIAPDNQIVAVSISGLEPRVWRIRQERFDERLPRLDDGQPQSYAGRGRALGG